MKQLPIPVLKGCPCLETSLFSLCVPSGFGGRAGSEVSTGQVFRQGVLVAITFFEGLEMEGLEPEPHVSWASPVISGCHHPLRGRIRSQSVGAEALRARSELILFLLSMRSPPLPTTTPSPQRGAALEQEGPE